METSHLANVFVYNPDEGWGYGLDEAERFARYYAHLHNQPRWVWYDDDGDEYLVAGEDDGLVGRRVSGPFNPRKDG